MTTIPLEAQECANCYFSRSCNKFRPHQTGAKGIVYCHFAAPSRATDAAIGNPVAPVREDAWCGQWRFHPAFAELVNV
jgi:hypothetical protein